MTRPPPLQLRLDNMLPNLGIKPPMSLFQRMYETNWRGLVIGLAAINALRFALRASNAFRDQQVDFEENLPNLARVSVTLGVMYSSTCLIEVLGFMSAFLARPYLIRAYVLFVSLSLVIVTAAGTATAVGYFTFADDIVQECVSLATTGRMDSKSLFRSDAWHIGYNVPLSLGQAQSQCLSTWNTEAASEVISVIIFSLAPSTVCFLIVWTWGRQIREPGHCAYLGDARSWCCCATNRGPVSALQMEECSPLYRSYTHTPATAHSHHITAAMQTRSRVKVAAVIKSTGRKEAIENKILHATTSSMPPRSITSNAARTVHSRALPPPPLPLERVGLPHQTSAGEHFQTMSPFALSPSPSPYGVTPGPPSFIVESVDYGGYMCEYQDGGYREGYEEDAHGGRNAEHARGKQEHETVQMQRGRGEYWFV